MFFSQLHRFITEQQGRGKTKIEIRANIKVADQADIETGRERGHFGKPCFSAFGYRPGMPDSQILYMCTDRKAEMNTTLIDKRQALQLLLLRRYRNNSNKTYPYE